MVWPLISLTLLAIAFGCERESDLDEVFDPPRPINQVGAVEGRHGAYQLAADSEVTFTLGPRKRRVRGRVRVVHSEIALNPDDLAATRGRFTVDLASLSIDSAPAARDSALTGTDLTEQSLRWLEVGPGEAGPERFARFVIRQVGGLSAASAVEGRPLRQRQPGTVLRRVHLRVTGELELHGYRIPYTSRLSATFHLPEPARAGDLPQRLELSTREPLRLDLIEHEVVPRDARGAVLAGSVGELRKGSGHVARLSLRWLALPTGG